MRRLLLTLTFLLLAAPAWAAIVCGNETNIDGAPPADPLQLTATPDTGSNRVWIIHVTMLDTDADNTVVNGVTSSAGGTFNLYGNNVEIGGVDVLSYIFYSTDFVDGSQTLSVDYNAAPLYGNIVQYVCTGVRKSNPWLGTATTSQAAAAGISINVPCMVGGLAIDAVADSGTSVTPVVGADQTQMYNDETGGTNNLDTAGSTEPGAATNTMSWTETDSGTFGIVGGCLVPAPSGGQPIFFE